MYRVLLATVRDKGFCPCPRCEILKSKFDKTGLIHDMRARITRARIYLSRKIRRARNFIYNKGYAVGGTVVERVLKATSLVPTIVSSVSGVQEVVYVPFRMRSALSWDH